MTISETITIQASTPPTDLPHDTAAAEIARLPDYMSGTVARDDGTDYVVTSSAYKDAAGNAGRVSIDLDPNTNAILAIQSKVGGNWTNWMVGSDSIADDAITPAKLAAAVAGSGLSQNGTNDALEVNVDASTLEISSDTLQVKVGGIGTTQIADESVTADKIDPAVAFQLQQDADLFSSQTVATLTASGVLASIANDAMPSGVGNVFCVCPVRRTDTNGDTDSSATRCRLSMYLKFYSDASNFFIAGAAHTELTKDDNGGADATSFLTVSSPIIGSVFKIEAILIVDPANVNTTFTTAPSGVSAGLLNLNVYEVVVPS